MCREVPDETASDRLGGLYETTAKQWLSTWDHILRTQQYINVIVAGKQAGLVWLSMDEAIKDCVHGIGIWPWAGTEVQGEELDVVRGWVWPDSGDAANIDHMPDTGGDNE